MLHINQVLTIAGSDSSGGAGIQADIKTITMLQNYAASVITGVTAQNTKGVSEVSMLSGEFVKQQLNDVLNDLEINAIKTGMLGTAEVVSVIASVLKEREIKNLVIDPVMVATSGDRLLDKEAISILTGRLFSLATVVTPNLTEAEVLIDKEINTLLEMEDAAKEISNLGPTAVLLKGGHREGKAIDLLYYKDKTHRISAPRIKTENTHGTGCTLSSAIASNLADGMEILPAIKKAKDFITSSLKNGINVGKGRGPVNHLWRFEKI
ncbi:bifunctional hydroxymethylpyrimidine kinase/phosphomethylpyrimidine kinase [Selenihalanaerobacter shriftii]|uniref:Hydroxymethylpyrimidine/phosphomethylpyrimidine kinase n=1 Tax=Selenihalanaerobacter shriftii TaxID=142842 RepID=A0A1T4LFE2_9FIRM|nr:bifunctional hydroxymethylpyrimidine kinase/phosphomethylpyrimidine kinase [Selenihalanaerobacter shriftii]SJZ53341.1 hydroxymethylpyrimidine/phosphomethylpyrimidine kinase [Selenihalanaerobacter shriftii]